MVIILVFLAISPRTSGSVRSISASSLRAEKIHTMIIPQTIQKQHKNKRNILIHCVLFIIHALRTSKITIDLYSRHPGSLGDQKYYCKSAFPNLYYYHPTPQKIRNQFTIRAQIHIHYFKPCSINNYCPVPAHRSVKIAALATFQVRRSGILTSRPNRET